MNHLWKTIQTSLIQVNDMPSMELTARQCMLVCRLLEESQIEPSLVPEYAEIMDLFLVERDDKRKEEEKES